MAIEKNNPHTIHLAGTATIVDDIAAIEAVTPGMLVEYHDDSGVLKWGVHDTADDPVTRAVALERDEMNLTIDDDYAANDLMKVGVMHPGSRFFGIIPSGQNIAPGDLLQSNGDGRLKAAATGEARFVAVESSGGAVIEDTRLRVEAL